MKGSSGTEVSPRGPCTVTDVGVLVSVTDGWIWMGFRPTCDIKPCGHAAVELKLRMALGSCDRNTMLGELQTSLVQAPKVSGARNLHADM
jgi:hypothetical protein